VESSTVTSKELLLNVYWSVSFACCNCTWCTVQLIRLPSTLWGIKTHQNFFTITWRRVIQF